MGERGAGAAGGLWDGRGGGLWGWGRVRGYAPSSLGPRRAGGDTVVVAPQSTVRKRSRRMALQGKRTRRLRNGPLPTNDFRIRPTERRASGGANGGRMAMQAARRKAGEGNRGRREGETGLAAGVKRGLLRERNRACGEGESSLVAVRRMAPRNKRSKSTRGRMAGCRRREGERARRREGRGRDVERARGREREGEASKVMRGKCVPPAARCRIPHPGGAHPRARWPSRSVETRSKESR